MSISAAALDASGVSRRLSATASVQQVDLRIERREIVALLGLNGAGKSTTLKMLAGVLVPDEGHIAIDGHSLADEPMAARQQLGFLPDTPPLYTDMRVHNFLKLAAKLRRVPRSNIASAVDRVVQACQLTTVVDQRIQTLSKGYRQRAGLAQALIHEPAVVLLDEPSNGLDPQQMDEMRTTIRALGDQTAIVFSTHLLSEAEAVCNRVVVMHHGKIVGDQSMPDAADKANLQVLADLFNELVSAA